MEKDVSQPYIFIISESIRRLILIPSDSSHKLDGN